MKRLSSLSVGHAKVHAYDHFGYMLGESALAVLHERRRVWARLCIFEIYFTV